MSFITITFEVPDHVRCYDPLRVADEILQSYELDPSRMFDPVEVAAAEWD